MGITVMQLVLRFMRIASAELLGDAMPAFKNPHFGSLIAIALTLFIVYAGYWQWIWVLFGGSNQLFASLALLLVSIWLAGESRRFNWTFIPAMFMYVTTIAALLWTSWIALDKGFISRAPEMTTPFVIGNLITVVFGVYMAIAALFLLADGLKAFNEARTAPAAAPGAAGD
jgi:carbon starvation protein